MNTLSLELQYFAKTQHLQGLSAHTLDKIQHNESGYSIFKGRQFFQFHQRIQRELLQHHIITHNPFTAWFQRGDFTWQQLKMFVVQFSVFSNLFIVAQLYKTINADSLESMHASKEILVNELGVVFNNQEMDSKDAAQLAVAEGSVEGGVFHFKAAHFEWLLKLAFELGLDFKQLGKRRNGSKATLFFCDALARLYGNEDYTISQASSFAVENWAAAGFWKELILGLESFQNVHRVELPIFFFTYHDRIEAQHALHTQEELEDIYFTREIDEDLFIRIGNEMLDAVAVFWHGLNDSRQQLAA